MTNQLTLKANYFLIGVIALLLAGCAFTPREAPIHQAALQHQLLSLNEWAINGKIAISHKNQGTNLSFDWQHQDPQHYVMDLSGALGQGASRLMVHQGVALLTLDDGSVHAGENADALVAKVLHWDIPLAALDYWVRGLPFPGAAYTVGYDEYHRVVTLEQQGWRIHYSAFLSVHKFELPEKLQASNGEVTLKVIIKRWELGDR